MWKAETRWQSGVVLWTFFLSGAKRHMRSFSAAEGHMIAKSDRRIRQPRKAWHVGILASYAVKWHIRRRGRANSKSATYSARRQIQTPPPSATSNGKRRCAACAKASAAACLGSLDKRRQHLETKRGAIGVTLASRAGDGDIKRAANRRR